MVHTVQRGIVAEAKLCAQGQLCIRSHCPLCSGVKAAASTWGMIKSLACCRAGKGGPGLWHYCSLSWSSSQAWLPVTILPTEPWGEAQQPGCSLCLAEVSS